MRKLFCDTEFTGLRKDTTLISIGCESDTGATFYAEHSDYDTSQVDQWIEENVIANLLFNEKHEHYSRQKADSGTHIRLKGKLKHIDERFNKWLEENYGEDENSVEVWWDVGHYDVVIFNDIFGGAFKKPKQIHYIHLDFATALRLKGIDVDINREEFAEMKIPDGQKKHNSLWDAKVLKEGYNKLMQSE